MAAAAELSLGRVVAAVAEWAAAAEAVEWAAAAVAVEWAAVVAAAEWAAVAAAAEWAAVAAAAEWAAAAAEWGGSPVASPDKRTPPGLLPGGDLNELPVKNRNVPLVLNRQAPGPEPPGPHGPPSRSFG